MEAEKIPSPAQQLSDKQALFEGLKNQEPWAIRHLGSRVDSLFARLPGAARVSAQDREELVNDTLVLVLGKLEEGLFRFQDSSPAAYAMAVAGNLLNNHLRKKQIRTIALEELSALPRVDIEDYYEKKEKEQLLGALLAKMGEDCRQLIRLRYYEGIKDEQVVAQQLTKYSTVDSLKNKRCKCLKKLAEVARQFGHYFR